jgi:DNA primase
MYAASPYSKYFGRLILPYNPRAGFASYFVARSYTGLAFPKYLNPSGSKNLVFFGPQLPDPAYEQYWNPDELVLVEGPFDMIKASRHGPAGAILGKELKHSQARIIVAGFSRVYLLLDNDLITKDPMARTRMRDLLELHLDVKLLDCPKKDPGEMEPRDFEELFK